MSNLPDWTKTMMEVTEIDKHSSLVHLVFNYGKHSHPHFSHKILFLWLTYPSGAQTWMELTKIDKCSSLLQCAFYCADIHTLISLTKYFAYEQLTQKEPRLWWKWLKLTNALAYYNYGKHSCPHFSHKILFIWVNYPNEA
jgi:hypothetical protein